MTGFLDIAFRPITAASIVGAIIAGIIMGIMYWRQFSVVIYNGLIFNVAFFVVLYISRRFVDGIDGAAGYIGIFLLYMLFISVGYLVTKILTAVGR